MDDAGIITDTYDYDAFGNLIDQTGITPNNYLYAGEQFDADLGMYFLRARYMDTARGRFWSMDTFEGGVADPITLHKYLYANASPTFFVDPSGNRSLTEVLVTSWLVAELALTVYDFIDFAVTIADEGASATDKLISAGGILLGTLVPGGGYGSGVKVTYKAGKGAKRARGVWGGRGQ